MAIECVFYALKCGEPTENKTAAEEYKEEEIKKYCATHDCPNNGKIIDDGMPNGAGTIPAKCWFGINAVRADQPDYTPIP